MVQQLSFLTSYIETEQGTNRTNELLCCYKVVGIHWQIR
jgi:hypothetical protein